MKQIRLLLNMYDIQQLALGKVLLREESGQTRGYSPTFTGGKNPVEIALNEGDRAPLHTALFGVDTSGGYHVDGDWPKCPSCGKQLGYDSTVVKDPPNPPTVQITCKACREVVATLPLHIPSRK